MQSPGRLGGSVTLSREDILRGGLLKVLYLRSLTHFSGFLQNIWGRIHLYPYGNQIVSTPFVESILPPLSCFAHLSKPTKCICGKLLLDSDSVPLINTSVPLPVFLHLDQYSFVVSQSQHDSSNLIFLFQKCFNYSLSFAFPYTLEDQHMSLYKISCRDCDWNCVKSVNESYILLYNP